jgi:tetratricopeptide (TPR) repeat protein
MVFALVVPLLIASVALFFVASRYRVPLLVALCVPSGALLDSLATMSGSGRTVRALTAVGVVLALGLVTGRDLHLDDARSEEETRMAVWLAANGRGSESAERLARIPRDHPLLGVAHFRVGQAFESAGRPREALLHFEQAVRLDPAEQAPREALARTSAALGLLLAQRGEDDEALRLLSRAAELSPGDPAAQLNLAVQLARMERFEEARQAAARALEIDPAYNRARDFLAALQRVGK